MGRTMVKDGHLKAGHDRAFRPAKAVRDNYGIKAPFEHMCDRKDIKKNFRDPEDGNVIIGPRNFFTNPLKVGEVGKGTSFGGHLAHLPDDLDMPKKMRRTELETHWETIKRVHEDKKFSQRAQTVGHFNSPRAVMGADRP